ncbi:MAG TPA: DUF493 domain-containing protein [Chromatiaceae bacterium]|jgi:putative lipoic acid-binding regulatory protein|nr:DUF493 domain-containing protein [Chromatiaceae bacterium]HIN81700.1 DUF493 domain-containing protein [Chromatiales bacterium]HIA08065.1 DUF493 domain-containing protein [Chromatiaceae bacterium]HIB83526.1 DUF493 domain-containing protein [Chromatiaceae bacterium]HIO14353.1 DUF493 domain-containing protein [Chromatiales bacterium]
MSDDDTLLEFPCEFPIKIFGRCGPCFDAKVTSLVRQHVPDLSEGAIKSRPSSNGNYLAVTITFTATSKAQIDAIYMGLTGCEDVIMVL